MGGAQRPLGRDERARRKARRVGAVFVTAAFFLPIILWHRAIGEIASEFQPTAKYLVTGWSPWVLMLLGLACFIPVGIAEYRDRDRRFYRAGTGAWIGWGVTLYLLGFGLATQVVQITGGLAPS